MSSVIFSGARTDHLSGTVDGSVPFIGRTAVLRLAALRLAAQRGTVLVGRPGIGKSRTLRMIERGAEQAALRVAHVIASRSIATVPFGAFLTLLPLELTAQAAAMGTLDRALLVRAGVLGLGYDLIGVDDAHLLDDESASLLLDLARTGTTVAMVVDPSTTMPDALRSVPDATRAETVTLPPFAAGESAQLIESVLQGPVDGGTALVLHEAAQGVPLVLRELLEVLQHDGMEQSAGVWALSEPVRAPEPVQARALEGLRDLDPRTRAWVELVAVATGMPADLAATLVDDDTADRAELTGWVRLDDEQHAFRLENVLHRDAVLAELGPRARRRMLRALVDGTEALGRALTEAERVDLGRWRLDLGDELDRDDALGLAATTSPSDPALAERFLRAAAADDDALGLVALAQHLIATGGVEEAERLLQRAETAGGQEIRVVALTALATGLAGRRPGEALEALERVLERHPDEPDLLAVQIALLAAEARSADAVAVSTRLAALPDPGAGAVLGEVYGAVALAVRGDQAAAVELSDSLLLLAEENVRALPEGPMLQAWLQAAVPWAGSRDPRAAVEIAQRGYDRTLRAGLRPDRARFAHLLAAGRLLQGDATLAVRLLREAESAPCFWRDSRRPEIVASLVEALVLSGEQQEAERTLDRLDAMLRTPEQHAVHDLARAAMLVGRGDVTAAAALALQVGDTAADRGDRAAAADAWTAALRYGSTLAARHLIDQGDNPGGSVRDLVREHAAAAVAHDAAGLLAVAAGYWEADVRVFALEATAAAARWSLEAGDSATASTATEQLLRWSVSTPGLADALPLAGLTAREQEIVRLAATGMPDKGIADELGISVRTAQTHLGRAFNKLGVHDRHKLAHLLPAP